VGFPEGAPRLPQRQQLIEGRTARGVKRSGELADEKNRAGREPGEPGAPRSLLVEYLRLFRLPNIFTAVADVTMGYLFVHQEPRPVEVYLSVAAASAALYAAGVVLNDVWDVEEDRRERPDRPLASGRIAVRHARRLGFALLVSGVLCGGLAGQLSLRPWSEACRGGAIAALLAVSILLYNAVLKRTVLGPLCMGLCRMLNVLLGMSIGPVVGGSVLLAGFGHHQLLAAGGIGLYVVGVTWFARTEARVSSRGPLVAALAVMAAGIALLATLFRALPDTSPRTFGDEAVWFLLLGLLAVTIVRRCLVAVWEPVPAKVRSAVRHAIWSLVPLDAAVALLVSPTMWPLLLLTLLIPTFVAGQWIEST